MFRMKPTYIIERVTDINLEELKNEGLKGLIFDLDNTLIAPKAAFLMEDIKHWLEKAKVDFKIAIVSNNPHMGYLDVCQKELNVPVYGKAGKPRRSTTIKALKEMELLPNEVAIVGDRPLTDILVGVRLGLTTILVDPLIKHQEIGIVKLLRKLERIFVKAPHKNFSENNRK